MTMAGTAKRKVELSLKGVRSKESARKLSGKLWPTGEFSVGVVKSRPDERLDERPMSLSLPDDDGSSADASGLGERGADRPLNLSNVPNSQKSSSRPEKYGRTGITGYGKKMIKSVGALISRDYPRHRVTFSTITMPAVEVEERREMARLWPEFLRQLLQKLRRALEDRGLPVVVCSVTEIQPKRLASKHEGYLHLHLLWLNSPGKHGNWTIDVLSLRNWAYRFWLKRQVIDSADHININVRPVRGDVANYLAKYCSKGGDVIAEFAADNGWDSVPGQWWNMPKSTRDWVKANVCSGTTVGELMATWLNYAWDWNDFGLYRYVYHVEIEMDGALVNIGWRGCLTPDALEEATAMLAC